MPPDTLTTQAELCATRPVSATIRPYTRRRLAGGGDSRSISPPSRALPSLRRAAAAPVPCRLVISRANREWRRG